MRLRLGNKHHLRKPADRKAQISSVSGTNAFLICAFDLQIFSGGVYSPSAISFSISNSFWYSFDSFFRFFGEKEARCSRKFDRLLCCFDPLSITPFDSAKNANRFEKCNVFGNGKCELSAIFTRGETEVQFFGKEKRKTLREYWGAHFWQGEVQNSSPILARRFRRERTVQPEIPWFALLLRSPVNHAIWQCKECEPFRKVERFWQRKVWTQRHSRVEKLRCNFLARKSAKLFVKTVVHIFGKEKCKTHRQFSATMVTSLPSFSLSLYLSLSLTECTSRTI